MRPWSGIALAIIAFLLAVALVLLFQAPSGVPLGQEVSYSQILRETSQIRAVVFRGDVLTGHFNDGHAFRVRLPRDASAFEHLPDRLAKADIQVVIGEPEPDSTWLTTLFVNGLPLILYTLIYYYPLLRVARALEALLAAWRPAGGIAAPPKDDVDARAPSS